MTLSQRTILIVVSTFIALLFILGVTSDVILLSSYSELEKEDISSHTKHIANGIDDKLEQLALAALSLAEQVGVSSQLSEIARDSRFTKNYMQSQNIDLAAVYDNVGQLVLIKNYNCEKKTFEPATAEQMNELAKLVATAAGSAQGEVQGVVGVEHAPLLIAIRPVTNIEGVRRGFAIVGWYVDAVEIERGFRSSGTTITVHNLQKELAADVARAESNLHNNALYSEAVSDETVAGYFHLKDVYGKPQFIVRAVEKRLLYTHGKATITYIFTALLIAGGVICGVMLLFVRGTILNRLRSLTAKVCQITEKRDISSRLPLSAHEDELHTLALSINSMLDSLEHAETAIRESEGRYRMLFDRAPDAIIIIGMEGDEAGRIMAANTAAAEQHGYTVEELLTLSIYDLNTPETNKIAGAVTKEIEDGDWVITEMWHQKKDGTQFPIEVHAGLIKIGGKKYILGFDRDITQRKLTEETDHLHMEQIRQLNSELSRKALDLAAANHELETFNYSVSHDMRGPLTRISGYCQLLLEGDCQIDDQAKNYITKIYESETWLNDMIDALLQLAHLTRTELVADTVDLSILAENVLGELALMQPERVVTTVVQPGVKAVGDARLLKMVLVNLFGNAWKYSARKDVAQIEFGAQQSETGLIYFVKDNGAGFNMKDSDKLFRVFTRLHDASQFDGTGIGLATVQRIIFRHGGHIWADAQPDRGATIFFTIP